MCVRENEYEMQPISAYRGGRHMLYMEELKES
jgi:hypothetical protein